MNRRDTIKSIAAGTLAGGVLLEACKLADKKEGAGEAGAAESTANTAAGPDRQPDEIEHYNKLIAETFYTEHEMATIAILCDIIVPRDEVSGSATEAKVPEFIEFITKDMPEHQVPMRGGLRWLDMQSLKQFSKTFRDLSPEQRISLVDQIAYPAKSKPEMAQGVAFFNRMRDLTLTGFYTSEMGVKDLGYVGNAPNQWDGVPDEVLKQYGIAYEEKELTQTVKFT